MNFTELFSFGLLLVDFLLSFQMQEQFICHSAPYTGCCVPWTWRITEFVTDLWKDVLFSSCWPLHGSVEKMSSDSDVSVAQLGNRLTTCCSNWLFRAWKWEEKNRFWQGMLLISWGSRYVSEVIHPCCTEPCLDTQLFNCMFYMIVGKEVLIQVFISLHNTDWWWIFSFFLGKRAHFFHSKIFRIL